MEMALCYYWEKKAFSFTSKKLLTKKHFQRGVNWLQQSLGVSFCDLIPNNPRTLACQVSPKGNWVLGRHLHCEKNKLLKVR